MTKTLLMLLPILAELFEKHSHLTGVASELKNRIKDELRAEILSLSIKFLFGLILTSVIIFSLISIGQQINVLLLAFENGHLFSIGLFAVLTVLCAGTLATIFRTQKKPTPELKLPAPADLTNDLSKVITSFMNGFAEGMLKTRGPAAPSPQPGPNI